MKRTFTAAAALALLGAGCALTHPLRPPDSLDNATRQTWTVTAGFASGKRHTYLQEPESFSNFGVMTRGPIPVLTQVSAVSTGAPPARFVLSAHDLGQLRRMAPGGLTLVLYDDGIACLSPALKRSLEGDLRKREYTRQEYFRQLRAHAAEALRWTAATLARK
jgi:hypothetical protein